MLYTTPQCHRGSRIMVHPGLRQPHIEPVSAPLYVITAISNPYRFRTRYHLYRAFEKMCEDSGAILYTIELALRDRHHEVTSPDNPRHIQLRSPSILWHKENLINIAISRLPADWEYVAWVDADIQFARPDWVVETIHQLQIYKIIQMWSHAVDLGPELQPIASCTSFISSYLKHHHSLQQIDRKKNEKDGQHKEKKCCHKHKCCCHEFPHCHNDSYGSEVITGKGMLHTGYAWAARRSAIADLGRLGEIGILGSGDRHMAYALIGQVVKSLPKGLPKSYYDYWLEWERRSEEHIKRNVGIVPGMISHYWHGSKQHRRYQDRWRILIENNFDWTLDLKKDPQGILTLTERNIRLRDDLRAYFGLRNEDSIDL